MSNQLLIGLVTVAVILQVWGISTNRWGSLKQGDQSSSAVPLPIPFDLKTGLWKICQGHDSAKKCDDLPPSEGQMANYPSNSLYAVRGLTIAGAVLCALSLTCVKSNKHYACMLVLLGGVLSLAGTIVWAVQLKKMKDGNGVVTVEFKFDYSYYLSLFGGILAVLTSMICLYKKQGYMEDF